MGIGSISRACALETEISELKIKPQNARDLKNLPFVQRPSTLGFASGAVSCGTAGFCSAAGCSGVGVGAAVVFAGAVCLTCGVSEMQIHPRFFLIVLYAGK